MEDIDIQSLAALLQAQQQQQQPLLEFKAGILQASGNTVTADPRRGTLRLVQSPEGVLHLNWVLRPSGTVEHDITLFPQSAKWERVAECKSGRVYLLKFNGNSQRKWFFWMQEPSEENDEEYAQKINEYIQNPPSSGMGFDGGSGDSSAALMQMLGNPGALGASALGTGSGSNNTSSSRTATISSAAAPSTTSTRPAAQTSSQSQNQQQQQQQQQQAAAAAAAALQEYAAQLHTQVDLSNVLEADRVIPHIDEKTAEQLMEHLPESQRNMNDLRATLRSPQLQQQLARLSHALNSAQFGTVMASLGLPHQGNIGVQGFLQAVQNQADRNNTGASSSSNSSGSNNNNNSSNNPSETDNKNGNNAQPK